MPKAPDANNPKVPLRTTLKRLYSLAWPERWPIALATLFLLGSGVSNLALPPGRQAPYKKLAGLEEIVLVAHDERRVDLWRRSKAGWRCTRVDSGVAELVSLGCELSIAA